ncbi:MAG: S-layer homology domain-containing protein [Clostridia bacterium]|jgi:hypothetical protein|nr:S-layer homology domain-containing protein [Clostridia bacterium]MDD3094048.1 S-layer homology domain-containing protein [Clostridia bacterium]MDD3971741.1 S-layer homology domain-containing protein [Clostridia bacterium]MDD4542213.1 S-layer homology domain-containing protein [Clostridia bacterium]HPJ75617.1 S-layer homology domain-containing protein [Clostridia bacterium]
MLRGIEHNKKKQIINFVYISICAIIILLFAINIILESDKKNISIWAYDEVSAVVDFGIFVGNDKNMLLPGENFKYSEAVTAIRNLLMSAGLIN